MVEVGAMSYEPFGEELNGSVAMMQAATVIDIAVAIAVESRNVDKLMDAAAMWIGLAERLGIEVEEDEDELGDESRSKKIFGFSGISQVDEPTKEVVAEDA